LTSSANRPARRRVAGERSRQRTVAPAAPVVDDPGVDATPPTAPAGPTTPPETPTAAPAAEDPAAAPPARVIPPRAAKPEEATAPPREASPRARLLAWAGLGLSLVALAVSLLLWVESGRAADRRDGTRAATAAARTAVETMLSYDYKTFDQHTAQVDALLTGAFRTEFDNGTRQSVKPLAVANQAVVQARASEVGVMSASDNTVRVLAFVNQATTSAKLDRPQVDQNRVILTMSRVDDRWLVSKVEAF
jgi:Mce-associated membrane protein